jgi:hypothetical protein
MPYSLGVSHLVHLALQDAARRMSPNKSVDRMRLRCAPPHRSPRR